MNINKLKTVKELAEINNCTRTYIYNLISMEKLQVVDIKGLILVDCSVTTDIKKLIHS